MPCVQFVPVICLPFLLASLFFLPVLPRLSLHSKGYKGNNNSRLWKLTDRNDVKHTRQCQFDVDDLDIGNGGVAGEVEHRLASQLKKGKKRAKNGTRRRCRREKELRPLLYKAIVMSGHFYVRFLDNATPPKNVSVCMVVSICSVHTHCVQRTPGLSGFPAAAPVMPPLPPNLQPLQLITTYTVIVFHAGFNW